MSPGKEVGGVPIPERAIGRVGMIAMLRRVRPEDEGKLVAVRFPVGRVHSMESTGRPVFAWQVLMLGPSVELNGLPCREIVVADRCLEPVSQVDEQQLETLTRARSEEELAQALDAARRIITQRPLTDEELDAQIDKAGEMLFTRMALEVVPLPVAFREMDFRGYGQEGDAGWHWSGLYQGRELYVLAGQDLFDRWTIVGQHQTERNLMWDERVLPPEAPRGAIVLHVLNLWRNAFGRDAPVPGRLSIGALYERHLQERASIGIGLPTLRVDGEVFRATRRWLSERYRVDDDLCGPRPDGRVGLAYNDGILRVSLDGNVLGCPASGVWVGDCEVSLRELLAMPGWRWRGDTIALVRSLDSLSFNGHDIALHAAGAKAADL